MIILPPKKLRSKKKWVGVSPRWVTLTFTELAQCSARHFAILPSPANTISPPLCISIVIKSLEVNYIFFIHGSIMYNENIRNRSRFIVEFYGVIYNTLITALNYDHRIILIVFWYASLIFENFVNDLSVSFYTDSINVSKRCVFSW